MNKRNRLVLIMFVVLAVIGLVDSFVVFEKISGNIYAPCIIGSGCDTVLYSYYSKFLGVSLSWWGMGFYTLAVVLSSLVLIYGKEIVKKLYFLTITAGFLFSLHLFYVQVFDIRTLCTYCMISFSDLLLSVVLMLYQTRFKSKKFAIS